MGNQNILVSIIVPVYNVEKYLECCIKSLQNQTYKNIEILLIDDGSTDKSGQICDGAAEKDSRIRVIHKQNSGVSDSRNMGIDLANGQYICFLDSDDVYAPYSVDCLLNVSLQCDADISIAEYREFEDKITFELSYGNEPCMINGREAVRRIIGKEHVRYTVVHNKLFKADLIRNFRFVSGKIHEDEEFMYRILYSAKNVATIAQVVYGYRTRSNSITTAKYNQARMIVLQIAKDRAEFFKQQGDQELYENFSWVYAMMLLQHYPRVKKDLKNPTLSKTIKNEFRKIAPGLLHAPRLSTKRKLMTAVFSVFPGLYAPFMEILVKSIRNVRVQGQ